jgi:hypothetical protein
LAHRRLALGEQSSRGIRVAGSMLPTLVFTLVLAGILRDRFDLAPALFGGLVVYAIGTTLIPGLALYAPTAELTRPHVLEMNPGAIEAPDQRAG